MSYIAKPAVTAPPKQYLLKAVENWFSLLNMNKNPFINVTRSTAKFAVKKRKSLKHLDYLDYLYTYGWVLPHFQFGEKVTGPQQYLLNHLLSKRTKTIFLFIKIVLEQS